MRINMETRKYIQYVVVFAKSNGQVIVYSFFLISLYINKCNSLTRRSRLALYEFLDRTCNNILLHYLDWTLGRNVCTLYKIKAH